MEWRTRWITPPKALYCKLSPNLRLTQLTIIGMVRPLSRYIWISSYISTRYSTLLSSTVNGWLCYMTRWLDLTNWPRLLCGLSGLNLKVIDTGHVPHLFFFNWTDVFVEFWMVLYLPAMSLLWKQTSLNLVLIPPLSRLWLAIRNIILWGSPSLL